MSYEISQKRLEKNDDVINTGLLLIEAAHFRKRPFYLQMKVFDFVRNNESFKDRIVETEEEQSLSRVESNQVMSVQTSQAIQAIDLFQLRKFNE